LFHPKQLVITPYAEQAKRLRDLLLKKLSSRQVFGRPILSYSDFLKWVLPELGGKGVSEIQRKLILEEVLTSIPLTYYEGVRDIPGFIGALSGFISEWKGLFLADEDFEKALSAFPKNSVEVLKLQDLKAIYLAYEGRLRALGFNDFDDVFQNALQKKGQNLDALKGIESIAFDGFYDFQPSQIKLMELIRQQVTHFTIYLTHEEESRPELFDLTINTIQKLEAIGFKKKSGECDTNHRTSKSDLQYLEKALFTGKPTKESPRNIQIYEAVGLRGEVLWMVRQILRIKRKTKMAWSDMAILFRQIGDYESYLQDAFEEYRIPYVIHERKKVRENPWARHLLNGLQIAADRFENAEGVFHFLKSSYLPLSREVIADFEQFAESKGSWKDPEGMVQILSEWQPADGRRTTDDEKDREQFIEFIKSLFEVATQWNKDFSLEDFSLFLEETVVAWGPGAIDETDQAAQVVLLNILSEIRINQEASGTSSGFQTFFRAFEKGFSLSLFSVKPNLQDAVQIYNVQLARQKEYKIVFLGGLLQKNFPGMLREDTVLKDGEREQLKDLGFEKRLPRRSHERYYFYLAVTRPTEKLFLTYPRFDLEGKESLPSFFVGEVRRLFTNPIPVKRDDKNLSIPEPREAVSLRDLENYLAAQMGEKNIRAVTTQRREEITGLYNFLVTKKALGGFQAPFPAGGKDVCITKKILKEALQKKSRFSPTALESFGGCSIRYYFEKVMGLREPLGHDSPLIVGTLFHDLLKELLQEKAPLENLKSKIDEHLSVLKRFHPMPYEKKLAVDSFYEYLSNFLDKEREYQKNSDFKPTLFEETASFGLNDDSPYPALPMKFEGEWFELIGEMDRVDVNASHQALILDYKLGKSRRLDKREIEKGTHLQLPLYGIVLKTLWDLEPVGYIIYSIKGAKRSPLLREKLGADEFKRIEDLALGHAVRYVKGIRKAQFLAKPNKCPDSCPFLGACRFEKWRKVYLEMEEGNG